MLVGVNTLELGPGLGGREIFIRNTIGAIQRAQPDTGIILFTDDQSHDVFNEWKRVRVTSPKGLLDAVGQSRAQALLSPLETALPKCPIPQTILAMSLRSVAEDSPAFRWFKGASKKNVHTICAAANAVIAPSEFLKRELLELYEVPLDRVVVAPLGVDAVFDQLQTPFIEPPYLLSVGRTCRAKNFHILTDVMEKLWKEIPHTLVVVGREGDAEPSRRSANVIRVEQVPTAQLAALHQHCALAVFASPYEGSGVGVLEALRGGAAVVCGRVGGIPEVAGTAPIYFNAENPRSLVTAIRRGLGERPSERERRISLGKKQGQGFSWEDCAWKALKALRRT
jgi:glycosyltransferase involved in cell wall biosynthesis